MLTMEALRRRIDSVEDLKSVVRTMKALSAVSIRQYEKAVNAISDYHNAIELGLRATLRKQDELAESRRSRGKTGFIAVILGSDHGLCGQFNDKVVDFALNDISEREKPGGQTRILAIGLRAVGRLESHKRPPDKNVFTPAAVSGVTATAREILLSIDEWRSQTGAGDVMLYYNAPAPGAPYKPAHARLMPVNLARFRKRDRKIWPSRSLPCYTMDRKALLSIFLREFFFVSIYRAIAMSSASEHSSRLAAMQAAEKNIEEHLQEIRAQFQALRQDIITAELLDVVSGFEALRKENRPKKNRGPMSDFS